MDLDVTLETLENSVVEMAYDVINQHKKCITILEKHDKEAALKIIKKDEYINNSEEDINNQVIAGFALLNPLASDLRRELVAIKISSELERIGDYAKGLASFIIKRDKEEYKDLLDYAIVLEKEIVTMLEKSIEAYKNLDLELAFEVPTSEDGVNTLIKEFRDKLETKENIDLKYVFYLSGLFRNIQRSADHITNICEHIVYLIKGIHYDFD